MIGLAPSAAALRGALPDGLRAAKAAAGARAYQVGLLAEERVAEAYLRQGHAELARRWRGKGGEIDLIVRMGDEVVFVEVKCADTHAYAAERLSSRQVGRLMQAAEEFLDTQPLGALTPMRFDVALVDRLGRIDIIENALWT